ncbi:hypothetical protein ISN44_As02g007370 [Arabidopsis suecica]|uniref:Uncharacterized protein n=1 Tax=Arabidopsis suecica TaxID=45249 RepID=A0A8T2GBU9_ARASU|nr:hypothetical protein ISN44_As02g007370 [Arabidopsis suecica]
MNGSDNSTPSRPWSITQPSLAFSSLPPLSPSPSSSRRNSIPLMNPSASVESRDSSIRVKNKSLLPPLGVKRRAPKDDIEPFKRHYRSLSVDSCLSDLLKLPPSPNNVSSSRSVDGEQNASGLEFDTSVYTDNELNKIAKSTKLKEVASDPKENDKTMRMNEKKEIMIRTESLEQQAELRDALTEHLHSEIERLKAVLISNEKGNEKVQNLWMATCEVLQNRHEFNKSNMQVMDPNVFNWSEGNPGFNGRI